MPSARRVRRINNKKGKKKNLKGLIWFFGLILFFSLLLLLFSKKLSWGDNKKLTLVVGGEENVFVVTFDAESKDVTRLLIPNSVQVDAARGFGKWKLGSIWQLGKNEKAEGVLLSETVVKNFGFPVSNWVYDDSNTFAQPGLKGAWQTMFSGYRSNLGLFDRLKLSLLLLNTKESDLKDLDLSETNYLKKTKLTGGEEGYVITGSSPTSLVLVFSDLSVSKKMLRVLVKNQVSKSFAEVVSPVVEFLGAKVVSEVNDTTQDLNCVVTTKEKAFGENISKVFGCIFKNEKPDGNLDVEVKVGDEFGNRY